MEKVLEKVEFLVGDESGLTEIIDQPALDIFSENTVCFLSEISKLLLKSINIRDYPDVATFAFFCRRANINKLKISNCSNTKYRIGKGILFHITPGNVPVNFAYSLFAGLVTGNINIIRLPSKNFEQVAIIIAAINKVLLNKRYKSIFSKRLYLVRYKRDINVTSYFSTLCDSRIIWGGDDTIHEIRKSPIPPKSTDVTFSDRYSISVIKADKYSNHSDKARVALDFYNDTYLFDQNACTSPQTIFWFGSKKDVEVAQNKFWGMLQHILHEKNFELPAIQSVNKLTTFYSQAISYGYIEKVPHNSNALWRVKNRFLKPNIEHYKCNSGYFNEFTISSLDDLTPVLNRKFQTIGYMGFTKQELETWLKKSRPLGIDRIVPIGRTMDFAMIWDGYDLISSLTRTITIS